MNEHRGAAARWTGGCRNCIRLAGCRTGSASIAAAAVSSVHQQHGLRRRATVIPADGAVHDVLTAAAATATSAAGDAAMSTAIVWCRLCVIRTGAAAGRYRLLLLLLRRRSARNGCRWFVERTEQRLALARCVACVGVEVALERKIYVRTNCRQHCNLCEM